MLPSTCLVVATIQSVPGVSCGAEHIFGREGSYKHWKVSFLIIKRLKIRLVTFKEIYSTFNHICGYLVVFDEALDIFYIGYCLRKILPTYPNWFSKGPIVIKSVNQRQCVTQVNRFLVMVGGQV